MKTLLVLLLCVPACMIGCGNKHYVRTHTCEATNHWSDSTVVIMGIESTVSGKTFFRCAPNSAIVEVDDEDGRPWRP